jgi:hypothetical protein
MSYRSIIPLTVFSSTMICSLAGEIEIEPRLLYSVQGDQEGDLMGFGVYALGDIDQDGYVDFAATTGHNTSRSYLRVFSGINGREIYTVDNDAPESWIGSQDNCASLGDIDGDGVPDFIVGNSKYGDPISDDQYSGSPGTGRVVVYSGANGKAIRIHLGNEINPKLINFGNKISVFSDLDGDGYSDYCIRNGPGHSNELFIPSISERVPWSEIPYYEINIFSGLSGKLLTTIQTSDKTIPTYAVALNDINGDGTSEIGLIVATIPNYIPAIHVVSGSIRGVLDFERISTMHRISSFSSGEEMRYHWLWTIPDIDNDKIDELIYVVRSSENQLIGLAAASPVDGDGIWKSMHSYGEGSLSFRQSVTSPGDLNNDGIPDLLFGSRETIAVTTVSGSDGSILHFIERADRGMSFGDYVVSISDLDGDSINEIAISDRDSGPGTVNIYSFGPASKSAKPYRPENPQLTVHATPEEVTIAWPAAITDPQPEWSTDLQTWLPVFEGTAPESGRHELLGTEGEPQRYFRLRYAAP